MVDMKVLPARGLPGNFAVWHGRKGRRFAVHIGKRRRDALVRFVVRNCRELPVTVSMVLLDRVRQYAAYPIMLGVNRKVGFVIGQFFVLVGYEDLNDSVRTMVGEKTFGCDEMIDLVCS